MEPIASPMKPFCLRHRCSVQAVLKSKASSGNRINDQPRRSFNSGVFYCLKVICIFSTLPVNLINRTVNSSKTGGYPCQGTSS